jgi:hypothetical protein
MANRNFAEGRGKHLLDRDGDKLSSLDSPSELRPARR